MWASLPQPGGDVEQPISICANMTSSIKPEIRNVSLRHRGPSHKQQQQHNCSTVEMSTDCGVRLVYKVVQVELQQRVVHQRGRTGLHLQHAPTSAAASALHQSVASAAASTRSSANARVATRPKLSRICDVLSCEWQDHPWDAKCPRFQGEVKARTLMFVIFFVIQSH